MFKATKTITIKQKEEADISHWVYSSHMFDINSKQVDNEMVCIWCGITFDEASSGNLKTLCPKNPAVVELVKNIT